MINSPVYRIEPDGTETVIGYAPDLTEAIIIIEGDREKIDYDIGYHWQPPAEETA